MTTVIGLCFSNKMKSYKLDKSWCNSTASSSQSSTMKTNAGMSISVCRFQNELKLLPKEKQEEVTYILGCYHQNRNIYYLAESLKNTLLPIERETVFPVLRQVLPKSDRPGFDQFTCEKTYGRKSPVPTNDIPKYRQGTDDSGIGSNSASQSVGEISRHNSDKRYKKSTKPSRSSSMSELSRKSESARTPKRFSSGTFGSAVRRKIQAALSRKSSSTSREIKATFRRRHNSDSQLSDAGTSDNINSSTDGSSRYTPKKESNWVCIRFSRQKHGSDLGFTIGGGSEIDSDIFVSEVQQGSPADKAGLTSGDVIMQINDVQVHNGISHETAAMMLKSSDRLSIYFKPTGMRNATTQDKGFSWKDTRGRPVSPPHDHLSNPNHRTPVIDSRKSNLHLLSSGERKVTLTVQPDQSLGLMIRGGSEYGLGIYVTGVDKQSAAENSGLKAGDEILEVNNVCLNGATHAEAVNLIRSSEMLIITVRHVGKIPQACLVRSQSRRLVDDRISLHSSAARKVQVNNKGREQPNGVKNAFQRRVMSPKQLILPNMHVKSLPSKGMANISSTMSTLEDALLASSLWMTLSDQERRSVRYYVKEYAAGHVTPDALVLSLSELLNDHEKFSLMSAVRECINDRDLDRFDVLVLRREIEVLKSRHQTGKTTPDSLHHENTVDGQLSDPVNNQYDTSAMEPAGHSTPNDSFTPVERDTPKAQKRVPKLSPVRPTANPPPPPVKTPPAKPKRSNLRRSDQASTSSTESSHSFSHDNKTPTQNNHDTENDPDRSSSPYSMALKNHKSSHSGRIKIGPKSVPSHHVIPSKEFFEVPDDLRFEKTAHSFPLCKGLIQPVKNPSLRLRCNPKKPVPLPTNTNVEVMSCNSSLNESDFPPPPSFNSSTTSINDTASSSTRNPQTTTSFSLRSSSFGSSVNSRVTSNMAPRREYPVKADVHQPPSNVRTNNYRNQPEVRLTSFSCQNNGDFPYDSASSEETESSKHPYFGKDVDLQKVVIFRTTRALGLTLEGGAGTKQPLPRVLKIQPGSCAYLCARLRVGHILHAVNGLSLKGKSHEDAIRSIATAFKQRGRDSIELSVSGPYD